MQQLIINGGSKLEGEIQISGAKNSILPILAASLLSKKEMIIKNVPNLSDVHIMLELLNEIGSYSSFDIETNTLTIFAKNEINYCINNAALCEKIRTSSLFLGSILTINDQVKIPKPGGCKIGDRLIDMHLHFLKRMGCEILQDESYIFLKSNGKLIGTEVDFYKTSVGATQNIMIAASLACGVTKISGASLEPEIADVGNFLISLGVKIEGLGTNTIVIYGAERENLFQKTPYKIIYDRLEVGTYAILALATKSKLFLKNACYEHLEYFLNTLRATNAKILVKKDGILISTEEGKNISAKSIITAPYPYFPTDLQQIYSTLMCIANGSCIIEEKIFDGRFIFIRELIKMGAKIYQEDKNKIFIEEIEKFKSNKIYANDLRGSMALLIAGIMTEGETTLHNSYYLNRGYENFEQKLKKVGVKMRYSSDR